MKLYNYIILTGLLTVSSCAGKLDVLPQQDIAAEVALSTDANVKRVLNGAYDALSDAYVLGGDMSLFSELLASNGEITWEGTYNQPREVYTKRILVTNSFVRDIWLTSYQTINIANNILSAISVVNEDDRNRVKGEALLIRAISYFELAKMFCQPYSAGTFASTPGLPIILTPTKLVDEASKIGRSTLQQTYAQIILDMKEAETLLPDKNGVFLSGIAANAYLARVYLQMGDYGQALSASNKAITAAEANGFALTGTYSAAFNNSANSSEDIFAVQVSDQDGDNDMQLFWSIPAYGGRDGDVSVQAKHLALYETGDERLKLFYTGAGATRSGKWMLQYKNIPVIRLAELYLTRAECNFRQGSVTGATPLSDLNKIRSRVSLKAVTTLSLDAILKERKLELAHEGQSIHDLKRLKGTSDNLTFDAPSLVLPIPQREINANSKLVQNDGYK